MKHSKILLITIAIILLLCLAGGYGYLKYQEYQRLKILEEVFERMQNENPPSDEEIELDETADWQTYTNEEYGFSFKYPEGWAVKLREDYQIHLLPPSSTQIDKDFNSEPGEGEIYLLFSRGGIPIKAPKDYDSRRQIKVDGIATMKYIGVPYGQELVSRSKSDIVSFSKGANDYSFINTEQAYSSQFDRVLSTFKSTE